MTPSAAADAVQDLPRKASGSHQIRCYDPATFEEFGYAHAMSAAEVRGSMHRLGGRLMQEGGVLLPHPPPCTLIPQVRDIIRKTRLASKVRGSMQLQHQ